MCDITDDVLKLIIEDFRDELTYLGFGCSRWIKIFLHNPYISVIICVFKTKKTRKNSDKQLGYFLNPGLRKNAGGGRLTDFLATGGLWQILSRNFVTGAFQASNVFGSWNFEHSIPLNSFVFQNVFFVTSLTAKTTLKTL